MLKAGDRAPGFALEGPNGPHKLSDAKGNYAVVYFYPRDNTPGCTREAIAFSAQKRALAAAGAVVFGISKDSTDSHARFVESCKLTIDLLSDPDLAVHKAYGAYGEKVLYGKRTMGTIRSTFIVDPKGVVARVFPKVSVDGHADAVLSAVLALQGKGDPPAKAKAPAAKRPAAKKTGAR